MLKTFTIAAAALIAGGLGLTAPAAAQSNQTVLVVYGNDPCPTTKGGDEVVVCARKPESDRYRIPEGLRTTNPGPNERWQDRAKSLEYVGASGTASCSATGAGGWTGCWSKLMNQARDERKADAEANRSPTDTTPTGDMGIRAVVKGNQ